MLPFASMSTPVALLHVVMPSGNVAQLSTDRYDPESAAIDGRLAADWNTTAAHTTAIRTRLIKGSFRREVFGCCNPTRSGAIDALHLRWPRDAVARTYCAVEFADRGRHALVGKLGIDVSQATVASAGGCAPLPPYPRTPAARIATPPPLPPKPPS